jgi:signal transduction histidine kinase
MHDLERVGDPPAPHPNRTVEGAVALAGAVLCALAAAITLAGNSSHDAWLEATARALMVGTPIAVGLYARRRPSSERFGRLLILAGFCCFATTLAEASDPVLYSVGRIFGWVVEPLLLYLVLAFPTGRLRGRADTALVWAGVVLVVTLYLPTALLVDRFPEPVQWSLCHGGCPGNAFMVAGAEPAIVEDFVRPLREVLTVLLFAAVSTRLAMRIRDATPLMRRTLAPVLGVAALRLVSFSAAIVARRIDPESQLLAISLWSLSLGVPLMAVVFLLGLARWRLFIATAMGRLATLLTAHPRPEDLRAAFAGAFDDPPLEIVYWVDARAGWVDERGDAVAAPADGSGRCLTEIRDGDRRIAAVIHDDALRDEPAFIDAATSYAVMTIDNDRLSAEAADLLAEVQDSRARIQASADDERRRIERDLHDGAQQRLVALRIKLELAAERIDGTDGASAGLIRQLGTEVDGALDEVRSLARGIYPSPLADRGLVEGLRSVAMQAALPTTVLATGVRTRYPRDVESAAYFSCLEAVQNAAKHASGATVVVVELSDNGVLRFEVRDGGAGFDAETARAGIGLTSMRDRLAAVGGELAIVSAPGRGTRVIGRIPLAERNGSLPRAVRSPGSAASSARSHRE